MVERPFSYTGAPSEQQHVWESVWGSISLLDATPVADASATDVVTRQSPADFQLNGNCAPVAAEWLHGSQDCGGFTQHCTAAAVTAMLETARRTDRDIARLGACYGLARVARAAGVDGGSQGVAALDGLRSLLLDENKPQVHFLLCLRSLTLSIVAGALPVPSSTLSSLSLSLSLSLPLSLSSSQMLSRRCCFTLSVPVLVAIAISILKLSATAMDLSASFSTIKQSECIGMPHERLLKPI